VIIISVKKALPMILALILILTLFSACKNTPQQSPSPSPTATASAPAETTAQASPPAETPSEAPSETPAATSPAADTGAAAALQRGTWDGGIYENTFAGIRFAAPEGWYVASDEEIAALMGQAADLFTDEQKWVAESAKLTTIYDMMAQDPETMTNVAVMFENLSVSGGLNVTEEDYLEIVTTQLSAMETLDYTFEEPGETSIGGVSYDTVMAYEENNDITQYYMVSRVDNYMVVLLITLTGDTEIGDILAYFK
jgi:hypothetical protein